MARKGFKLIKGPKGKIITGAIIIIILIIYGVSLEKMDKGWEYIGAIFSTLFFLILIILLVILAIIIALKEKEELITLYENYGKTVIISIFIFLILTLIFNSLVFGIEYFNII